MERKRLNREQQEVLSLLKEVDMICRKHQITYYLSPWLTLCAVTGRPFPLHPLAGKIIMKVEDMERFRTILEAGLPEGRVLESMKNNKRFPGLFLRYENKNTLCFRLDAGRNYQYPGMGVDIIPLRGKNSDQKVRAWDQRLETGWIRNCDDPRADADFYRSVCGCFMRLLCIAGRKKTGERLYGRLCRNQNTTEAKKYTLRWDKDHIYTYPAEVFRETKEIIVEGERFLIPADEETYLSRTYGKNYKTRDFDSQLSCRNIMYSARVSFEDFFKETGSIEELLKVRRKQCRIDSRIRHYKEYFNLCWNYARACGDRKALRVAYNKKKEYIQNLWENRDLVRLETVFRPCRKMMKRCFETGDIFEMDEEIMEIYLDFLRANGNTGFLDKIRQYRKGKEEL